VTHIPREWTDITDRLGLERTFGRRIVIKKVEGEKYPFVKMAVPDGVQIIGFNTEGLVILITEDRKDICEKYTHLVGETVESGEAPEVAARRGLLEETGYKAGRLIRIATFRKDSAHLLGRTIIFIALGCEKIREPEEGMIVKLVPMDEAENTLREYISANPEKTRSGGNSITTFSLARWWLDKRGM